MVKINKKTILIVGANSSIGKVVINAFLNQNYSITATTSKKSKIKKDFVNYVDLDLTSTSSIKNFCEKTKNERHYDIVIFFSGIIKAKKLSEYSNNDFIDVMNVNFIGQAILLKSILNRLSRNSLVIFTSSISADRGSYDPIYSASKGAINSFIKSLLLQSDIKFRVLAISPGLIKNSSMYNSMPPKNRLKHLNNTPTKKLMDIDDLSNILINICSPHWQNINGEIIHLNGGAW
jgi:3-oxoacyl-[acyl-carrier protein] reductase